ncbi:MAG: hypothetical protein KJ606_13615, partial [Chloroflexi bacterium]|nr:hypothetical protein [Chloroflexota bacterium]
RYSLTGLNFILFVLLLPAIYFAPNLIKDLVSETSVLTILLFSIAIGYLMDMLKVYQFAPNFNKNKAKFRKQISDLLEIPVEHAGSYFSITSKMWDENSTHNLERRRAEWVLILHTAAALFISLFVWICLVFNDYLQIGFSKSLYVPVLIIIATFLLTIRLYRVALREIAKDNREFLLIMSANKKKLKDAWRFSEKSKSN